MTDEKNEALATQPQMAPGNPEPLGGGTGKAPPKESGTAALVEIGERGILLRSFDDLLRFARLCVQGGAAPKGMSEGAAAVAIQAGMERGLGPLGGLQQIVVINGVLSWRGQAAVALIRNSGLCKTGTLDFWVEGEGEERMGVCVAHRVGYRDAARRSFTMQEARLAGLRGKDSWKSYPDRMLQWRAVAFLTKDIFSDVLGGFPIAEEAIDYDQNEWSQRSAQAVKPRELPPPSRPDPLLDAIEGKPVAEPPDVAKPEPKDSPSASGEAPTKQGCPTDPPCPADPPYPSHAEADRAIAEADTKSGPLFREKK